MVISICYLFTFKCHFIYTERLCRWSITSLASLSGAEEVSARTGRVIPVAVRTLRLDNEWDLGSKPYGSSRVDEADGSDRGDCDMSTWHWRTTIANFSYWTTVFENCQMFGRQKRIINMEQIFWFVLLITKQCQCWSGGLFVDMHALFIMLTV